VVTTPKRSDPYLIMPLASTRRLVDAYLACHEDFILLGPPATGKSSLLKAAEAGHPGCRFVALSCTFLNNSQKLYQMAGMALAIALGQPPKDSVNLDALSEMISTHRDKALVLLLDNADQLNFEKISPAILELKKRAS
jgi:hypothetical protein